MTAALSSLPLPSAPATLIEALKGLTALRAGAQGQETEETICAELQATGAVDFAEIDQSVPPALLPNDTYYSSQWFQQTLNSPGAWDLTTGNANVIVAVCDGGVDAAHPDLAANLNLEGLNTVDGTSNTSDLNGHGTKGAGCIGAIGNNGAGVCGVAWNIKILPVRVTNDPSGAFSYYSDMAEAITWSADQGAKVVNMSYMAWTSSTVDAAAQYLRQKGVLYFASAGNSGADLSASPTSGAAPLAVGLDGGGSSDPDGINRLPGLGSALILHRPRPGVPGLQRSIRHTLLDSPPPEPVPDGGEFLHPAGPLLVEFPTPFHRTPKRELLTETNPRRCKRIPGPGQLAPVLLCGPAPETNSNQYPHHGRDLPEKEILMKPSIPRANTWLLLCFGLCASHGMPQDYDFATATRLLTDNLAQYTGNVLVVVEQGDREIYRFQAGTTLDDTKYGLASCSKWLSGAIILRMQEKGLFQFDDRIGKYLPLFDGYSNENGVSGNATIVQCCGMKAGFFTRATNPEIDRTLTLEESVNQIAANVPLAFPSGTQLAYEGCGLQITGRICEVLDPQQRPWRTIAADELFTPVGMANCDYNYLGNRNPGIAGGAQGTPRAYLRFLRTILNGGVTPEGQLYLRPRSIRRFLLNQTRDLPEHNSPFPDPATLYPNNTKPDYGCASWIVVDDPQYPQSQQALEVSSPGAFGSWPWIDRKRNLRGIIFMFDNRGGMRSTLATSLQVVQAIRDAVDAVGEPPKPAAVITASTLSGRAPLTVRFDASASRDPEGDALTCVWDFGTAAVTGPQATRTFMEAGTNEVILSVTDRKGSYATASVTITVSPPNAAPVALSQSLITAEDKAVTLTLAGSDAENDALAFALVTPPAHGALTGSAPNLTYVPDVNYHGSDGFAFKVNDGTLDSSPATVSITVTPVNDAPVVDSGPTATPNPLLAGEAASFFAGASDVDGDALSYAWAFGDGAAATLQNPAHAYASPGTFTATVTVSDAQGGSSSASVAILVVKPHVCVSSISLTVLKYGARYYAAGEVLVVDHYGAPVGGATVGIQWSGAAGRRTATAVTGQDGRALFVSAKNSSRGPYTLAVTSITVAGLPYDPAFNVVTTKSATYGVAGTDAVAGSPDVDDVPGTPGPLAVKRLRVTLDFLKEHADGVKLLAQIEGAPVAAGGEILIEVAGVHWILELDPRGLAKSDNVQLKMVVARSPKAGTGTTLISFQARGQDLAKAMADQNPGYAEDGQITVPVMIQMEAERYAAEAALQWKGKAERGGTAK